MSTKFTPQRLTKPNEPRMANPIDNTPARPRLYRLSTQLLPDSVRHENIIINVKVFGKKAISPKTILLSSSLRLPEVEYFSFILLFEKEVMLVKNVYSHVLARSECSF